MTDPASWKHVKDLLYRALEQEPHEREQFLRKTCGEDPALRAEVESLLLAHEKAGSFVERPAFAGLTQSAEAAVRRVLYRERALEIGDRVGTYEITEFLAAGGMGEVYRARDTKLHRNVAIKMLARVFTSDLERLTRFDKKRACWPRSIIRTSRPSTLWNSAKRLAR